MIVHWPKGIKAKGEVRSQWHHVIDVGPTVLEAAGLPQPTSVNGTIQEPIQGVSMLYSFNNGKTPDTHKTQYFEIFGNGAISRRLVCRHYPSSCLGAGLGGKRL